MRDVLETLPKLNGTLLIQSCLPRATSIGAQSNTLQSAPGVVATLRWDSTLRRAQGDGMGGKFNWNMKRVHYLSWRRLWINLPKNNWYFINKWIILRICYQISFVWKRSERFSPSAVMQKEQNVQFPPGEGSVELTWNRYRCAQALADIPPSTLI